MPGSKSREALGVHCITLSLNAWTPTFSKKPPVVGQFKACPHCLTCSLPRRVLGSCFSAWILSPAAARAYSQFSHALCSHTFLDCLTKTGWEQSSILHFASFLSPKCWFFGNRPYLFRAIYKNKL